MDKWEYCTVGPMSTGLRPVLPGTFCELWYVTDSGIEAPPELNLPFISQDPVQYTAQLIWLLGEDGWELVGSGTGIVAISTGSGEMGHMLYFKRKKQGVP